VCAIPAIVGPIVRCGSAQVKQIPWEAMEMKLAETARVAARAATRQDSASASKGSTAKHATKCPLTSNFILMSLFLFYCG